MTEAEWLATKEPAVMWDSIQVEIERKFCLYAVACCRRIWHLLTDERARKVIETLEQFADGNCERKELNGIKEQFLDRDEDIHYGLSEAESNAVSAVVTCLMDSGSRLAWSSECYCTAASVADQTMPLKDLTKQNENDFHCHLIRDIFGNPFRPVTLNASWLTSTVMTLANGIYDEKAFDRMPILADALQDAGCDDEDILKHCRQTGEHVRGCWVSGFGFEQVVSLAELAYSAAWAGAKNNYTLRAGREWASQVIEITL